MGHPKALTERIRSLIETDYPPNHYRYAVDVAVPGTRMRPDILVFDEFDQLRCVAEIGYTRPEKLAAYRDILKIPDVRWYDKTGKLHTDIEVQQKVVNVVVELEPGGQFTLWGLYNAIECHSDWCEADIAEDVELEFEDYVPSDDVEYEKVMRAAELLREDVFVWVLTDYLRAWLVCFCDKCGESWFADEDDGWELMDDLLYNSPLVLGQHWKRYDRGSWEEMAKLVFDNSGMKVTHDVGVWLNENDKHKAYQQIRLARREAQKDSLTD